MLDNLKLSHRIWFGFSSILALAGLLGIIAIFAMNTVKHDATNLATEYVPAVEVANNVERFSLNTMYNMRGYMMSEEDSYLEPGKKALADVNKYLVQAADLGNKGDNLGFLKENAAKARAQVDLYSKLADESIAVIVDRQTLRGEMDKSAGEFMKAASAFDSSQSQQMTAEIKSKASMDKLNERLEKISLINDIIDRGNWVRVANFKSQALDNVGIAEDSMKYFNGSDGIYALVNKARTITHVESDLRELADIETTGKVYQNDMKKMIEEGTKKTVLAKSRGDAANAVLAASKDTAMIGIKATQDIANPRLIHPDARLSGFSFS